MTQPPAFQRAPRPEGKGDEAAPSATSRLNKRMAELRMYSRREADAWIEQGWVKVNGELASMGQQVTLNDRITVDKAAEQQQDRQVTILLHKPMGYVSGQAEDGHQPAITLINPRSHWGGRSLQTAFYPAPPARLGARRAAGHRLDRPVGADARRPRGPPADRRRL